MGGVGVLADDDEAFFGAQDVHGFGAVGDSARCHHGFPDVVAVAGGNVDFVGEFAGEADAEDARRDAGDGTRPPFHEFEGVAGKVDVITKALQDLSRLWPDNGNGRPVVGNGCEPDVELRPFDLVPLFEPVEDARRAAGGGGHVELVVVDAGGDAVVHHHAVFVEHQAVAAFAGFEFAPGVAVNAVQEFARVFAVDLDFAEGAGIYRAGVGAHGSGFAGDGGVQVFARLREVPRPPPLTDGFHCRTARLVRGVQGGGALWLEGVALAVAGKRAEGYRRPRRAVGGGADRGGRDAKCGGGEVDAIDAGQFALVGAETEGGVAFDVFDVLVVFRHGDGDVGSGYVVLVIDEGFGAGAFGFAVL